MENYECLSGSVDEESSKNNQYVYIGYALADAFYIELDEDYRKQLDTLISTALEVDVKITQREYSNFLNMHKKWSKKIQQIDDFYKHCKYKTSDMEKMTGDWIKEVGNWAQLVIEKYQN